MDRLIFLLLETGLQTSLSELEFLPTDSKCDTETVL